MQVITEIARLEVECEAQWLPHKLLWLVRAKYLQLVDRKQYTKSSSYVLKVRSIFLDLKISRTSYQLNLKLRGFFVSCCFQDQEWKLNNPILSCSVLLRPQSRTMQFISQILITIQIAILVRRIVIIMSVGKIEETLIYISPSHPHYASLSQLHARLLSPSREIYSIQQKVIFIFWQMLRVQRLVTVMLHEAFNKRHHQHRQREQEASKPNYQSSTDVTLEECNTNECLEKWSMKVLQKSLESPSETGK